MACAQLMRSLKQICLIFYSVCLGQRAPRPAMPRPSLLRLDVSLIKRLAYLLNLKRLNEGPTRIGLCCCCCCLKISTCQAAKMPKCGNGQDDVAAATSLINVAPKCQISEGYCFILCDFICTHTPQHTHTRTNLHTHTDTRQQTVFATCVKRQQQLHEKGQVLRVNWST